MQSFGAKAKAAQVLAKAKQMQKKPMISAIETKAKQSSSRGNTQTMMAKPKPVIQGNSKNVMNTVHNVTVASPTLKRKEPDSSASTVESEVESKQNADTAQPKSRVRTRTHTIDPSQSVLQKILGGKNIESQRDDNSPPEAPLQPPPHVMKTPSPIAFQISLESDTPEYDDDFESYESDFESEPSDANEDEEAYDPEEIQDAQLKNTNINIQVEDRKLDSGNYDMPSVSKERSLLNDIYESSERGQSEIVQEVINKSAVSILSERQTNLMKTLSLDMEEFHLFEQSQLDYDKFMRVFGHLTSSQAAVQTQRQDVCHEEMQTELLDMSNRWTQFPTKFSSFAEAGKLKNQNEEFLGVGLDNKYNMGTNVPKLSSGVVNFDRLDRFLICALTSIVQISVGNDRNSNDQESKTPLFNEWLPVELHHKPSRVRSIQIFGLVLVVTLEDPGGNGSEIVELYDAFSGPTLQRSLVSWNKISTILIHSKAPAFVLAGNVDGSINLWNWKSSPSYKLAPSDNFVPEFLTNYGGYCKLVKLVEIASEYLYSITGEDVASLYSPGVIVIWSMDRLKGNLKEMKKIELHKRSVENVGKMTASKFERNVSYFENNIFNDAALKDLQIVKSIVDPTQNLTFIDLLHDQGILISVSNQDFLSVTTLGLKNDTTRIKIPEAIEVVSITCATMFDTGLVLIALSNGTIKVQCIKTWIDIQQQSDKFDEYAKSGDHNQGEQLIVDKSCAIQNIVLSERKLYDDSLQSKLDTLEVKDKPAIRRFSQGNQIQPLISKTLKNGSYFQRSIPRDLCVDRNNGSVYYLEQESLFRIGMESLEVDKVDLSAMEPLKSIALSTPGRDVSQRSFMVNNKTEVGNRSVLNKDCLSFQVICGHNSVYLHK